MKRPSVRPWARHTHRPRQALLLAGLLLAPWLQAATQQPEATPFIVGTFRFSQDDLSISYAERIIGAALVEHGYRLEVQYFPGRRLLAQLNTGAIDGDLSHIFDLSKTFANIIRVDAPLRRSCALVYRLQGRQPLPAAHRLDRVKIGIYSGAPKGAALIQQRWPNAELVTFENIKQGIYMLMGERIDLLAMAASQRAALGQIPHQPIALQDAFYLPYNHMHVHRRHAELALKLADSIRRLKRQRPEVDCLQGLKLSAARPAVLELPHS